MNICKADFRVGGVLENLWFVKAGDGYLHRDLVVRPSAANNTVGGVPDYQLIDQYTGYFLSQEQAIQAVEDYGDKILEGELMNSSITYTELADRITLALGEQVHSYETTKEIIIKELINENRNEL